MAEQKKESDEEKDEGVFLFCSHHRFNPVLVQCNDNHVWLCSEFSVGQEVQACHFDQWNQQCRLVKKKGRCWCVSAPGVLGLVSNAPILHKDAEIPEKKSMEMDVAFEHELDPDEEADLEEEGPPKPPPAKGKKHDTTESKHAKPSKKRSVSLMANASVEPAGTASVSSSFRKNDDTEDDQCVSDVHNVKKRAKRERKQKNHWHLKFADKLVMDEENHWKCRVCCSNLKSTKHWTSSPLINHLCKKHKVTESTVDVTRQQLLLSTKTMKHKPTLNKKTDSIANMITQDLCPVSISDKPGFRKLLEHLAPSLKTVTRGTIRKLIMEKARLARIVTRSMMQNLDTKAHATTDCWSDKRNRCFVSLTARCVSANFDLVECPADMDLIKGRHTGENLCSWLEKKVEAVNMQVLTMTCDSASNQVKAARLAKEAGIITERLACVAHVMNLVVQQVLTDKDLDVESEMSNENVDFVDVDVEEKEAEDDMDERLDMAEEDFEMKEERGHVSDMLMSMRKLIVFHRKSNLMSESLRNVQMTAHKDAADQWNHIAPLSLLLDCKTRWSSTCIMLKRALMLRRFMDASKGQMFASLKKKQRLLFSSDDQWQLAEEVSWLLSPFATVTKRLSGSQHVSAGEVAFLWSNMMCTLKARKDKQEFITSDDLVDRLLAAMQHFWNKHLSNDVWLVTSLLDPNHKSLKFLKKSERARAWNSLEDEIQCTCQIMSSAKEKEVREKNIRSSTVECDDETLAQMEHSSSDEDEGKGDSELTRAKLELAQCKMIKLNKKVDVLSFWKRNKDVHPFLSMVARVHLAMNSSSAVSERVFSVSGFITSGRKSRISASLLCALLFLHECVRHPSIWKEIEHVKSDKLKGKKRKKKQ